jgi:hypothetical protein
MPGQFPCHGADLGSQARRAPLMAFEHAGQLLTERLPASVRRADEPAHTHHDLNPARIGGDRSRSLNCWASSCHCTVNRVITGADRPAPAPRDPSKVGQTVGVVGQPVAQLPLAVALAATPTAHLDGDPAAYLGQRGVGQLHDVKMIDDGLGVR